VGVRAGKRFCCWLGDALLVKRVGVHWGCALHHYAHACWVVGAQQLCWLCQAAAETVLQLESMHWLSQPLLAGVLQHTLLGTRGCICVACIIPAFVTGITACGARDGLAF
jgi:hypothetical protein